LRRTSFVDKLSRPPDETFGEIIRCGAASGGSESSEAGAVEVAEATARPAETDLQLGEEDINSMSIDQLRDFINKGAAAPSPFENQLTDIAPVRLAYYSGTVANHTHWDELPTTLVTVTYHTHWYEKCT
jgi:hypothetical protein